MMPRLHLFALCTTLLLASCGDDPQPEDCSDTIDNDGDGSADCADTDCAALPSCQTGPICGDGVAEGAEACDGQDLNGQTCADLGFSLGALSCNPQCTLDTSGCSNPSCGNGATEGTEACDDGNINNTDACLNNCAAASCGDSLVRASVETCDDGNTIDGDGCNSLCQIESCGDGAVQAPETCDDGNINNNDGCNSLCQIESCGDGVVQANEGCDDGNSTNGDGCSSVCAIEASPNCGDGVLDALELCDDGNLSNGDGCSSLCLFEINCAPGEVKVLRSLSNLNLSIPDDDNAGVQSSISVDVPGAVTNARVGIGALTHTFIQDLAIVLSSPSGTPRHLTLPGGDDGADFSSTLFVDGAASSILEASPLGAPFVGIFRPEQTLSLNANRDFLRENALGTWTLQLADVASIDIGDLDAWTLLLCVDPSSICGDGVASANEPCDDGNLFDNDGCSSSCTIETCGDHVVNGSERCDDGNTVSGDGCSASCAVEFSCAAGETLVQVTSSSAINIPDADAAQSTLSVGVSGALTDAMLEINITHPTDLDLGFSITSPSGTERVLSFFRGDIGDNYRHTIFRDGAPSIVDGFAPFDEIFSPEDSLSSVAGQDLLFQNPLGVWTLSIVDDTPGDTGTLDAWSLSLCVNTLSFCGNSVVDIFEQCDDGNQINGDGCDTDCRLSCGNGVLDTALGEECDDGNQINGDGCEGDCSLVACAAGIPNVQRAATAGGTCYLNIGQFAPWQGAEDACLNLGGHLVVPDDLAEESLVKQLVLPDQEAWIGFNDLAVEALTDPAGFISITGDLIGSGFHDFAPGEPNQTGDEDCVEFFTTGQWNDRDCSVLSNFICEIEENPCGDGVTQTNLGEECDDGNSSNGDGCDQNCLIEPACDATAIPGAINFFVDAQTRHCYASFLQSSTWQQAEALCESNGGYLSVPESAAENTALRALTSSTNAAWLGFNDIVNEASSSGANFRRVTGGTIGAGFKSFAAGEPNNFNNSDCVNFDANAETWSDVACTNTRANFTCEIEPIPCGDGVLQPGESCDDGNNLSGDGCDQNCAIEVGFSCTNTTPTTGFPSVCQ